MSLCIVDFHTHLCDAKFWFKGKGALSSYSKQYFNDFSVEFAVSLPLLSAFDRWMKPRKINPLKSDRTVPFILAGGSPPSNKPLGVKVHPPLQNASADDPIFEPFYELAEKARCPVVIHFGYCSAGNLKFADPIVLDFIADSFPSVTFIMAHMGTGRGGYWENAKMVALKNDNVYLETSWAPPKVITEAVAMFGDERILFGSDYPFKSLSEELGKITSLNLPNESLIRILGENAKKLLRRVRNVQGALR